MEPRIRWSGLWVMVVLFTGLYLVLTCGTSRGHMEDPDGCAVRLAPHMEADSDLMKEGISEDGREYLRTWSTNGPIVQARHVLLPQSQWKDGKPAYMEPPLSYWLDNNDDGFYEEAFIDPKHQAECRDMIHLIWDGERQVYRLVAGGKEHI